MVSIAAIYARRSPDSTDHSLTKENLNFEAIWMIFTSLLWFGESRCSSTSISKAQEVNKFGLFFVPPGLWGWCWNDTLGSPANAGCYARKSDVIKILRRSWQLKGWLYSTLHKWDFDGFPSILTFLTHTNGVWSCMDSSGTRLNGWMLVQWTLYKIKGSKSMNLTSVQFYNWKNKVQDWLHGKKGIGNPVMATKVCAFWRAVISSTNHVGSFGFCFVLCTGVSSVKCLSCLYFTSFATAFGWFWCDSCLETALREVQGSWKTIAGNFRENIFGPKELMIQMESMNMMNQAKLKKWIGIDGTTHV